MAERKNSPDDTSSRLRLFTFDKTACKAAIHGEKIPHALGLPITRFCVTRGIRYHSGYGKELDGVLPQFTRALHARTIMDGRIPVINNKNDTPYCIWHPQVATEQAYRELVRQHPSMKYQVGRACAVAGYLTLYKELDLLPEVHIAEEARECGNMDIYEDIMSKPVRYEVMNDYTRTVSPEPRPGACLNGDTAVNRSLEKKQALSYAEDMDVLDEWEEPFYFLELRGYDENTFNITEDMNIDITRSNVTAVNPSSTVLDLLSSPLPFDLPTIDKNLLILMAAYYGDVDRYARLRRPVSIRHELICCVRGIYHNTMFACWWERQQQIAKDDELSSKFRLDKAISARMIMNNVLHRMMAPSRQHGDPYMIWWPSIAAESTYRELVRLRPSMSPQVLRACIAGGYIDLFGEVLSHSEPDVAVVKHANSVGGSFKERVELRVRELGGEAKPMRIHEHWQRGSTHGLQLVSNSLSHPYTRGFDADFDGLYGGSLCKAEGIDMLVSMPESWKNLPDDPFLHLDYEEWPPKELRT